MEEELFKAFQFQANDEIGRLRADLAALVRREAEYREECRRLWAACGWLRQAHAAVWTVVDTDEVDALDMAKNCADAADRLLGGLVPLTPAK